MQAQPRATIVPIFIESGPVVSELQKKWQRLSAQTHVVEAVCPIYFRFSTLQQKALVQSDLT